MWFPGSKFSPPQPRPSLGKSLEGCPRMSWRITSQNRQVWKKNQEAVSFLQIFPCHQSINNFSRLVPKTLHSRRDGRHQVLNKGLLARRISPSRTNPWWVPSPSLVFLDEERWSSATSPGRCFEVLNQVSFFRKRPWIHEHPATVYGWFMIIHHSLYYGVSTFPLSMDSIWFHGQATGVQHSMELFQNLLRVVGCVSCVSKCQSNRDDKEIN